MPRKPELSMVADNDPLAVAPAMLGLQGTISGPYHHKVLAHLLPSVRRRADPDKAAQMSPLRSWFLDKRRPDALLAVMKLRSHIPYPLICFGFSHYRYLIPHLRIVHSLKLAFRSGNSHPEYGRHGKQSICRLGVRTAGDEACDTSLILLVITCARPRNYLFRHSPFSLSLRFMRRSSSLVLFLPLTLLFELGLGVVEGEAGAANGVCDLEHS